MVDTDSGLVVARRDLAAAADLAATTAAVAAAAGMGDGRCLATHTSDGGNTDGGALPVPHAEDAGASVHSYANPTAAAAAALGIAANDSHFVPKRYAMERCTLCQGWVRCWEVDAHQEEQCPAVLQYQDLPLFRFVPSDAHGGGLLESEASSWEGLLTDQTLLKGALPAWSVILTEANRVETAYLAELRRKVKRGRALAQDAHLQKAGDGSLLRLLTDLVGLIATAITEGAPGADVHHRLGAAIEERGHARELFESTVYDDGAYKFGLADDWQSTDLAADLDAKIGGEAGAKDLIASICKRHGVNARDSSYVVLRALDREEQLLRSEGESERATRVIKVRNWKSRTLAKSMHRRQAGAAAVTDRISGRNALTSDMCIDALGSRNFQTTARPATQKYHDAATMDRLDPVYTFNLGRMLLAQNMYSEAVACLRGAVGLQASFIEARFTLGIALAKAADVEGPGGHGVRGGGGSSGGGRASRTRGAGSRANASSTSTTAASASTDGNGNELPAEVVDYLQDGLDLLVFRANRLAMTGEGGMGASSLLSQDMLRPTNPMVLDGMLMLCRILYQGNQFDAADKACRDALPLIVAVLDESVVTTSPTFKLAERVLFEIHLIAASTAVGLGRSVEASQMAVRAGSMLLSSRIADSPPCLAIKEQLMQLACRCTPDESRAVACGDAQLKQYDSSPYHKMEKQKLVEAACSYRAALELVVSRPHVGGEGAAVGSAGARGIVPLDASELVLLRGQSWWNTASAGAAVAVTAPFPVNLPSWASATIEEAMAQAQQHSEQGASSADARVKRVVAGLVLGDSAEARRGKGAGRGGARGARGARARSKPNKTSAGAGVKLPAIVPMGNSKAARVSTNPAKAKLEAATSAVGGGSGRLLPQKQQNRRPGGARVLPSGTRPPAGGRAQACSLEAAADGLEELLARQHQRDNPRAALGLARVCHRWHQDHHGGDALLDLSVTAYRSVVQNNVGAHIHDAVIELGEILQRPGQPARELDEAADLFYSFLQLQGQGDRATASQGFDDGYIYGELARLLVNRRKRYNDPRLLFVLIGLANSMGVGAIEEFIEVLSLKGQTAMIKEVYRATTTSAGETALELFFSSRGW